MRLLVRKGGLVIVTVPNLLSPQSVYWMLKEGKGSERFIFPKKLVKLMKEAGLKKPKIEIFSYWLPSFLSYKWAVKTSKWRFLNKLKFLAWLFSGIGFNTTKFYDKTYFSSKNQKNELCRPDGFSGRNEPSAGWKKFN